MSRLRPVSRSHRAVRTCTMDHAAALAVRNRCPRVAVRLQSCPRRLLELVEDRFDQRVGRPVLRGPQAIKTDQYSCSNSSESAMAATMSGSPQRTSTPSGLSRPGPVRRAGNRSTRGSSGYRAGDTQGASLPSPPTSATSLQRPLERHEVGDHLDASTCRVGALRSVPQEQRDAAEPSGLCCGRVLRSIPVVG